MSPTTRWPCVCLCSVTQLSEVTVTQSCQLCDPMGCSLPGSFTHGILQARILEYVAVLFSRGSSQPRDPTQISLIAGRFFTNWATAISNVWFFFFFDPMVCSLPSSSVHGILCARILEWVAIPFSRGIFPIQGSNPGLLHCRHILYHLNYQGSPRWLYCLSNKMGIWGRNQSAKKKSECRACLRQFRTCGLPTYLPNRIG